MPSGVYVRSLEARLNIGKASRGRVNYFKGKKRPEISGENNPFYGRKHSEETRKKMSDSAKKRPNNLPSHTGRILSESHKEKIRAKLKGRMPKFIPNNKGRRMLEVTKRKLSDARRGKRMGSLNHAWKGGVTPERVKVRNSAEYTLWKNAVFVRDSYTCQKYGVRGGDLVAHHILNFSSHKDLRFVVDNGITLSKKAHDEFHRIYGKENNNRNQLDEFLKQC